MNLIADSAFGKGNSGVWVWSKRIRWRTWPRWASAANVGCHKVSEVNEDPVHTASKIVDG